MNYELLSLLMMLCFLDLIVTTPLGFLADRIGRKPVLLLNLGGLTISQARTIFVCKAFVMTQYTSNHLLKATFVSKCPRILFGLAPCFRSSVEQPISILPWFTGRRPLSRTRTIGLWSSLVAHSGRLIHVILELLSSHFWKQLSRSPSLLRRYWALHWCNLVSLHLF